MAMNFNQATSGARRGVVSTKGDITESAGSAGSMLAPKGSIGALPEEDRSSSPTASLVPESVFARDARIAREAREAEALRAQAAERSYVTKSGSVFADLVQEDEKLAVKAARRDINAVKIISRLVAAIARKPGSGVPNAVKSDHLAQLLGSVHSAGRSIAMSVAPNDAHRGWVQATATAAALEMVASQWENDPHEEMQPIDDQLEALAGVFSMARDDEALSAVLADLSEDRYIEAGTPEIAQARIATSARLAAWDLYRSVRHPILGKGTFRYTYGMDAHDVVQRLMPEVAAIAKSALIRTDSLDLRTTHMQGSLRRISDLMGAEYVSRTRGLMNWISEDGIDDAEYARRHSVAAKSFETRVVPELVEWTRRNFLSVEAMATRLMEEPPREKQPTQRPAA